MRDETTRVVVRALAAGAVVVAVVAVVIAVGHARSEPARQRAYARLHAEVLSLVAEKRRDEHPEEPCPTVEHLRAKKELSSASPIADPWGSPYKIVCANDAITVVSFGGDRQENTPDDIAFRRPSQE